MWIGVLWAGLRVAMWITHVGGKFRHGLLEKSLILDILIHFWGHFSGGSKIDTEYDRKSPSASTLIKQCTNKGTQGVRARYGAELPPFISIVQCPGRPDILGMESRDSNRNATNAGPLRTNLCVLGGDMTANDRKAFQPEFGAYRGLARVLKSPSNPQNCRNKQGILEKGTFIFCAKSWYAPNPGSKDI